MKKSEIFQFESNIVNSVAKLYQRTEQSLNEDVLTLKSWMKSQPHLPEILDDYSLQNFLLLNKCSVERAKESIDMYYTLRSRIPDIYHNVNPTCPNMKEVMEMVCYVPLPKLTKQMYRVFFFKMISSSMVDRMEPHDVIDLAVNMQEIRLKEDVMFGDIIVYDMTGLTFGYLSKLTPSFLTKIMTIYTKIYSIPLKGVYVINSSSYVSTLLTILKSILKPKIFERIHVCEDTSILKEHFPAELLPKDYGGEEKSTEELHELWKRKLNQYQDRFDQLDKLRVNENLRPQKLENDDFLGIHGNFKTLSVD
ncbi:hypothetical protein Zmor_018194 [Zophobas morio]|uniref:CRAL-TRIO domain-containing protein n=1 Tax=Zophobas morio TaxID=2755281 RepID=A0AA38MDQ3_9CUCU|nr:hypothetical protein Zmor_018194 [Zophobas morio]